MDDWIDLGRQHYVRASEVIGVADDAPQADRDRVDITPWADASAVVILRGGHLMPSYVNANALIKRLRAAKGGEPRAKEEF